jgi:hypothetical protein
MDRDRFDAFTRLFASRGSRRAALGALLGAGLLASGLEAVARKGKGNGNGKGRQGKDNGKGKGKARRQSKSRRGASRTTVEAAAVCCSRDDCAPGPRQDLGGCCFQGRGLSGANFGGANLKRVSFAGATLIGANLGGANLEGACLVDADLTDATLGKTNRKGAVFCRTIMPDGSPNDSGCGKGTPCCPTCNAQHPCAPGRACCGGRCIPGDCCVNGEQSTCAAGEICCVNRCLAGDCCQTADCATEVCQRKTCQANRCVYTPVSGGAGPGCPSPRVCCEDDRGDLVCCPAETGGCDERGQCCAAESRDETCAIGTPSPKCGEVVNNCGQRVDCGRCAERTCQEGTCTGADNTCVYAPVFGTRGTRCPTVCCVDESGAPVCCAAGVTTCQTDRRCGCADHGDCGPDQRCCSGQCVTGVCCATPDCPDLACKIDKRCIDNQCRYDDAGNGAGCTAADNTPGVCCGGQCVASGQCCATGDCRDETCRNKECLGNRCNYTPVTDGQQGTNCTATDRFCCNGARCCSRPEVCTGTGCCLPDPDVCRGKCGVVTDNCNRQVDCGQCAAVTCRTVACEGNTCRVTGSQPDKTECTTTGGQAGICCGGACVAGTCCANADCTDPSAPVCLNNVCAACTADGQCGPNRVCCGGRCLAGNCCTDATCPSSAPNCLNNVCRRCTAATPCGAGRVCCNGRCLPGDCCTNAQCGLPSPTNPTPVCRDNICGPCTADAECADRSPGICQLETGICFPCRVCLDPRECPFQSVGQAVAAVNAGTTIAICPGRYPEIRNIEIDKNLTLLGAGAGDDPNVATIVDLDGFDRDAALSVADGVEVTIQNLSLVDGRSQNGGCITNGGTLTLDHATVSGCAAERRGGGIVNGGDLTLDHATISGCTAGTEGGGIWNSGSATLVQSTVAGCEAGTAGGGIYNGETLTLEDSVVSGCSAVAEGGGVFNTSFGELRLVGTTRIRGNRSMTDPTGQGVENESLGSVTCEGTPRVCDNPNDAAATLATNCDGRFGSGCEGVCVGNTTPGSGACSATCTTHGECGPNRVCCAGTCLEGVCCGNVDCTDPDRPVCFRNICVPCLANDQCGPNRICCDGRCPSGNCCTDATCPPTAPNCLDNVCSRCTGNAQCGPNRVCCDGVCRSGNCCGNAECTDPAAPVCLNNVCSACTASGQCGAGRVCCGGQCLAGECCANADCRAPGSGGGTHVCRDNVCRPCTANGECGPNHLCDLRDDIPDRQGTCQICDVRPDPTGRDTTLGEAVAAARDGDTVYICPGLHEVGKFNAQAFIADNRLTLYGAGSGDDPAVDTILELLGVSPAITNRAFDAKVMRLSILHGRGVLGGGVVNASASDLTLQDVTLSDCNATVGGGIYSEGELTLEDVTIADCTAVEEGGGIAFRDGGRGTLREVTISRCEVTGNGNPLVAHGGGIAASGNAQGGAGNVTMALSTIVGCTAAIAGGGVSWRDSGNLTLGASTISGCSAGDVGGGIFTRNLDDSAVILDGSVVSGCTAEGPGGGIFNDGALILRNDTVIKGNRSATEPAGQGIYNDGGITCETRPSPPNARINPLVCGNPGDAAATLATNCRNTGSGCNNPARPVCSGGAAPGSGACSNACTSNGDCRSGPCCDGFCVDFADCCGDADCTDPDFPNCINNICAACTVDGECGPNRVCCAGLCKGCCDNRDCPLSARQCCDGTCRQCCDGNSSQCPIVPRNTPICNAEGICVPCENDGQCLAAGRGTVCCAGECRPGAC